MKKKKIYKGLLIGLIGTLTIGFVPQSMLIFGTEVDNQKVESVQLKDSEEVNNSQQSDNQSDNEGDVVVIPIPDGGDSKPEEETDKKPAEPVDSSEKTQVTVNVKDFNTGKSIKGVSFDLSIKGKEPVRKAKSDANGKVVFSNVPRNFKGESYVISPSYDAREPYYVVSKAKSFKVYNKDMNLNYDFYMSKTQTVKIQINKRMQDSNGGYLNAYEPIKKEGVKITVSSGDKEPVVLTTNKDGQVFYKMQIDGPMHFYIKPDKIEGLKYTNEENPYYSGTYFGKDGIDLIYHDANSSGGNNYDDDNKVPEGVNSYDHINISLRSEDGKLLSGRVFLYAPAEYYKYQSETIEFEGRKYRKVSSDDYGGVWTITPDKSVIEPGPSTWNDKFLGKNYNEFVVVQQTASDSYGSHSYLIESKPQRVGKDGNLTIVNQNIKAGNEPVVELVGYDAITGKKIDKPITAYLSNERYAYGVDGLPKSENGKLKLNGSTRDNYAVSTGADGYWPISTGIRIEPNQKELRVNLYPKSTGLLIINLRKVVIESGYIDSKALSGNIEITGDNLKEPMVLNYDYNYVGTSNGNQYDILSNTSNSINDRTIVPLPLGKYTLKYKDKDGYTYIKTFNVNENTAESTGIYRTNFNIPQLIKINLNDIDDKSGALLDGSEFTIYRRENGFEQAGAPRMANLEEPQQSKEYETAGTYINYGNSVWEYYGMVTILTKDGKKLFKTSGSNIPPDKISFHFQKVGELSPYILLPRFETLKKTYDEKAYGYDYIMVETKNPDNYKRNIRTIDTSFISVKPIDVKVDANSIDEKEHKGSVIATVAFSKDYDNVEKCYLKLYSKGKNGTLEEVKEAKVKEVNNFEENAKWDNIPLKNSDGSAKEFVVKVVSEGGVVYEADKIIVPEEANGGGYAKRPDRIGEPYAIVISETEAPFKTIKEEPKVEPAKAAPKTGDDSFAFGIADMLVITCGGIAALVLALVRKIKLR